MAQALSGTGLPSAVPPERRPSGATPSGERVSLRGLILVGVTLLIGILVLPAASRAPLASATNSAAISVANSTPGTTPPAATGTSRASGTTARATTTTTSAPIKPSQVLVLVANGTSTNGAAGKVDTYLAQKGFSMQPATDATDTVPGTAIYIPGGDAAAGRAVVAALNLPSASLQPISAVPPVKSLDNANVIVVVGPDLVAQFPLPSTVSAPRSLGRTGALPISLD